MVGRLSKLSALALIAIIPLCAFTDELDVKVSLTSKARTVKSVLEDLGKQANVQLTTSGATSSELLILRVKDASLRETMDRIAEALGAEWAKEAGGHRLIRSQKLIDSQREAVWSEDFRSIQVRLANLKSEVSSFGAYNSDRSKAEFAKHQKNMESIQNLRPGGGAEPIRYETPVTPALFSLKNMVVAMPPTMLSQIQRRSREVFALTPTAMQKAMPREVSNQLTNLVAMHNQYVAQFAAQPKPQGEQEFFVFGGQTDGKRLDRLSEALFVVYRDENGTFIFELSVADSNGKICSESTYVLPGEEVAVNPPNPNVNQESQPIRLSDDAKKHSALLKYTPTVSNGDVTMFRSSNGSRSVATVALVTSGSPSAPAAPKPEFDSRWRNVILKPIEFDPLSFAASEFLLGAAEAMNLNLAATLDDLAAVKFAQRSLDELHAEQVLTFATHQVGCHVERKASWLIVRPKLLELARQKRIDRISFGQLAQNVAKEGRLSLDAIAGFAAKSSAPYARDGFADRYLGLIFGAARSQFLESMGSNFEATRLWGTLDGVRRNQLIEGGTLQLNLLSNQQRSDVHAWVFNSRSGPVIESPETDQPISRSIRAYGNDSHVSFGSNAQSLMEERTEFLLKGLPFDGFLRIDANFEDAVMATSPSLDEGKLMSAHELGLMQSVAANSTFGNGIQMPQYDKFKLGKRATYELQVHLSPIARSTKYLRDTVLDPGLNYVPFEQLPEAFRKTVESMRNSVRAGGRNEPPKQ